MNPAFFDVIDELERFIAGADGRRGEQRPKGRRAERVESAVLAALYDLSMKLASSGLAFEAVLAQLTDLVVSQVGAARGCIFLRAVRTGGSSYAPAPEELRIAAARDGQGNDVRTDWHIPDAIVETVLSDGGPVLLPADGPATGMAVPLALYPPDRSALGNTAYREPVIRGVLYVEREAGSFASEDLRFLTTIANHIAAFLEVHRQKTATTIDPVSGLLTRTQLRGHLETLARQEALYGVPFAVVFADLDGFHAYNEARGAAAGDELLKRSCQELSRGLRREDGAFRYGADKVVLLLPATDSQGAAGFATAYLGGKRELPLTISFGVASSPEHGSDPEQLLARADQALYRAKRAGGDRVVVYDGSVAERAPRTDRLAGILTGEPALDYKNVLALVDTVSHLGGEREPRLLLRSLVDKLIAASGAERGAILLADRGVLETAVARQAGGDDVILGAAYSRTVAEGVFASGEPICLSNAMEQHDATSSIRELKLRTVICVPLASGERRLGVLYLDGRAEGGQLTESHLPLFTAIARQAGLAVENARLKARLALQGLTEGIKT